MKRFPIALMILSSSLFGQNLRLGFPQIAVGEGVTTSIDLTNKGIGTFTGSLAVVDDDGFFLPVQINGALVEDFVSLSIQPNEVERFTLRSSGGLQTGHVLVWDALPEDSPDFRAAIFGTAVFRIRSGNELVDSIGVPQALPQEHFFVPAENGPARTGFAISNPVEEELIITMRLISSQNQLVDIETMALGGFEHRSFFLDEVLNLPRVFRGTVEVSANHRTFALALRQEGVQLSSVSVRGMHIIYDFELVLSFSRLTGEMALSLHEGRIAGVFRFDNLNLDLGAGVLTGLALDGAGLVSMLASRNGRDVTGYFVSTALRTSEDTLTAPVVWDGSVGTIFATRKQP